MSGPKLGVVRVCVCVCVLECLRDSAIEEVAHNTDKAGKANNGLPRCPTRMMLSVVSLKIQNYCSLVSCPVFHLWRLHSSLLNSSPVLPHYKHESTTVCSFPKSQFFCLCYSTILLFAFLPLGSSTSNAFAYWKICEYNKVDK